MVGADCVAESERVARAKRVAGVVVGTNRLTGATAVTGAETRVECTTGTKFVVGAAAEAECVAGAFVGAAAKRVEGDVTGTAAGTECVARAVAGAGANCMAEAGSELRVWAGDECLTKEEPDIVGGARAGCVAGAGGDCLKRAGDDCVWEARATMALTSGKAITAGEEVGWARAWGAVRRGLMEGVWSRAAAGWACRITGGKGPRSSALSGEGGAGKAVRILTGPAWGGARTEERYCGAVAASRNMTSTIICNEKMSIKGKKSP